MSKKDCITKKLRTAEQELLQLHAELEETKAQSSGTVLTPGLQKPTNIINSIPSQSPRSRQVNRMIPVLPQSSGPLKSITASSYSAQLASTYPNMFTHSSPQSLYSQQPYHHYSSPIYYSNCHIPYYQPVYPPLMPNPALSTFLTSLPTQLSSSFPSNPSYLFNHTPFSHYPLSPPYCGPPSPDYSHC